MSNSYKESVALIKTAVPACDAHSILNQLSDENYLLRIYKYVKFKTGSVELTLPIWIERIAVALAADQSRPDSKKKSALAEDVGAEAPAYIAATVLHLMINFDLVIVLGVGQARV